VKRVATEVVDQAVQGIGQAVQGIERLATEIRDRVT
jgi:hypothetical protein